MNLFSSDSQKAEIAYLRYLQCLNLVNNYLHVHSFHKAHDF